MPRKFNQLIAVILPLLKGEPLHLDECIHHLKHSFEKQTLFITMICSLYPQNIISPIKPKNLKSSSWGDVIL